MVKTSLIYKTDNSVKVLEKWVGALEPYRLLPSLWWWSQGTSRIIQGTQCKNHNSIHPHFIDKTLPARDEMLPCLSLGHAAGHRQSWHKLRATASTPGFSFTIATADYKRNHFIISKSWT